MILIGLGANLPSAFGVPAQSLDFALHVMADYDITVEAVSRFWQSAPVPVSDQPFYTNAVARVRTKHKPQELLRILRVIEEDMGRVRTIRNAPRILDLDLLAYGSMVLHTPALSLPHPRMHQRGFVLYPLQEIAPNWVHPVLGQNVEALIESLPPQEIQILESLAA